MNPFVRSLCLTLVIAVLALSALAGVWRAADGRLAELRFAATSRQPSAEIVFVDIDATSLRAIGRWPWPRSVHGQLLDRLMELGAFEVAFDIDFSAASTNKEDDAFAQALQRAGGYAYLATFRQVDANGAIVTNEPLPEFARHARSVLVNVDLDADGRVHEVPTRTSARDTPSIAMAFNPDSVVGDTLRIDYGIDLDQIPRIAAIDILNDSVDPALVRDRQVVIGAGAIELRDLFLVPRFGIVPGPIVQIAASETVRLGRPLTDLGPWPALAVVVTMLALYALAPGLRLWRLAVVLLLVSIAVEGVSLLALAALRLEMATMLVHVGGPCVFVLKGIDERINRLHQLRQHRARLAYLANHDVRTGARSATALVDELAADLVAGRPCWLLLVRFSGLDTIGASLGHETADAALATAYARLKHASQGSSARLETDIFATVWRRPIAEAEIAAILADLDRPYTIDGHRLALVAQWGSSGAMAPEVNAATLIQQARAALAVAADKGLKGVHYEPAHDQNLRRRQAIDSALRGAIEGGELALAFQLQVDMASRQTAGVEALVRWTSPSLGPISPAEFIPLAEESGIIVPLGAWVMLEACRQAMTCGWAGRLSVNVSPVQFAQDNVVAMVARALEQTGFPAERLDIEITESLFVEGGTALMAALEGLRALGASIAIDDFGTGYSSLNYLSRLPVDKLKVDQSFVRQLADPRGASVIEAIVSLGHRLDLVVVVEGVETEEQWRYLASIGCSVAQGYLFGKPTSNLAKLEQPIHQPSKATA